MSSTPYPYSPLVAANCQIRILCFEAKDDATDADTDTPQALRCTIEIWALDDPDLQYTALSYTWGTPNFNQVLLTNGKHHVKITDNLHDALRELKNKGTFPRIWADAVCVNQCDAKEKEWQVPLMGKIYERASDVAIWLGAASEDSDLAVETFDRIGEQYLASGLCAVARALEEPKHAALAPIYANAVNATLCRLTEPLFLRPEVLSRFISVSGPSEEETLEETPPLWLLENTLDEERENIPQDERISTKTLVELFAPRRSPLDSPPSETGRTDTDVFEEFEGDVDVVNIPSFLRTFPVSIDSIRKVPRALRNLGLGPNAHPFTRIFGDPGVLSAEEFVSDSALDPFNVFKFLDKIITKFAEPTEENREALLRFATVIDDNVATFKAILDLRRPYPTRNAQDPSSIAANRDASAEELDAFFITIGNMMSDLLPRLTTEGNYGDGVQGAGLYVVGGELLIDPQSAAALLRATHLSEVVSASSEARASLHSLMQRPWWRRIWVIQEFCLARNPVLLCGSSSIRWHRLGAAIDFLCSKITDLIGYNLLFMGPILREGLRSLKKFNFGANLFGLDSRPRRMMKLRQHASRGRDSNLRALLQQAILSTARGAEAFQVTDPRDLVYGFLGMASDAPSLQIKPDYSRPASYAFMTATLKILSGANATAEDLSFLGHAQYHGDSASSPSLPSWFVDLANPSRRPPISLDTGLCAGGLRRPRYSAVRRPDDGVHVLAIYGFAVCRVMKVAPTLPPSLGSCDFTKLESQQPKIGDSGLFGAMLPNFRRDPGTAENAVLAEARRWLCEVEAALGIPTLSSADSQWADGAWPGDDLGLTMMTERIGFCGLGADASDSLGVLESESLRNHDALQFLFDGGAAASVLPPEQRAVFGQDVLVRSMQTAFRDLHRPAITDLRLRQALAVARSLVCYNDRRRAFRADRQLAIGPLETAEGDLVMIPLGGRVPFVLRQCGSGQYRLLGEAFVRGLMRGEYTKTCPELQKFSIV